MYSRPEIMDRMGLTRGSCRAELEFRANLIFLMERAGSAKSLVFDMIRETARKDRRILCICSEDKKKGEDIRKTIRDTERKLIVIDDADILLTDEIRRYIAFDKKNQYLIAGKNTDNLLLSRANLYELDVETDGVKTEIWLRNCRG